MSKTETPAADELNLPKGAAEIAKKLKGKLTIGDDGVIETDKDLVKELLPEGLTMDDIKRVQQFNSDVVAGAAHAVGEVGIPFLKKHPKVEHVHLPALNIGRDKIRVNLARERTVTGPGGKSATHHGYLEAKYTSGSAGTSGAAFKRIRDHHASEGAKLWGSKD
jgi:hypothetical protein